MKKISLTLITLVLSISFAFSQANMIVEAPLDNSTTQVRAPNGLSTYAYLRACALVVQSELTNMPTSTSISLFGFTLATTSTVSIPVTGNFTVYLQNTTDVAYLKGTNWATIPTGMTSVYASVMTIPLSSTTTSIILTLSTPFVYTGGGIYVAYDWDSAGPFSSAPATYFAENGTNFSPGCASGNSGTSAPTTLGTTAFRPSFLFGFANPYTNDIQVIGLESQGKVNVSFNTPHTMQAMIRNSGSATQNNISVNLNVGGANTFSNPQTITSLAAGASSIVTFAAFNPQLIGANSISVSVPSDQNNVNNTSIYSQSVTCNQWAKNPATGTYTSNAVGFGLGAGILATPYLNPVTSTITGVRGAISSGANNAGNSVYGVLLSSTGVIIATTNTVVLTNLPGFIDFSFATAQALTANTTYYLGLAQIANPLTAYYPAGTLASAYLPANLYFSTPIGGGALTAITQNYGYFGLEAVFANVNNVSATISSTAICAGESATLAASGANTYTWNSSTPSQSLIVSPNTNTVYSVAGTNTTGCISSTSVNLTVNPLPAVTAISSSTSVCLGNSVTLTANGASTYQWDLGPTTNTLSDSPIVNTVYTVTGTSSAGCSNTNTVEVVVKSFTPGITSSTAICVGNNITIVATGGAGTSYTWSTGFTGFSSLSNLTPSITTNYSVISVGSNGCSGTNSTTITVNPSPTITAVAQRSVMCRGESNTLTVSGASTYTWSNGSTSTSSVVVITPSNNITFNYSVTGTSTDGCADGAEVSVKVLSCTGLLENNSQSASASVFPNPSNGLYTVQLNSIGNNSLIEIRNALGSIVLKQAVTEFETKLDLQNQANGVYFIQIQENGKAVYNSRVIKN